MKPKFLFRINYINNHQVYELYAKQLNTDALFGFITLTDLVFDLKTGVVIDPAEEQLKAEFADVKTLHIPLQNVVKIEEVEHKKSCKIRTLTAEQTVLPIKQQPGPNK